jgi:PAS domain-containing protein
LQDFRLQPTEVLASIGVAVVAAALIILVWINASRSIASESSEIRARIEATVSGQAVVLADEVRHEMLGVEQGLLILKQAFQADPSHFNIQAWRDQVPALTNVTDDVFIADAQSVIQQDINPLSVGLGIGAHIAGVPGPVTPKTDSDGGDSASGGAMLIGPTVDRPQVRQHLAFLTIRLDRPGDWLVGAVYRTNLLTRLYSEASLGVAGMTALINTRLGQVQTIVGPGAANPDYDIANSTMYAEMQSRRGGTWIGPSAPDGVRRIHAFESVPGRELAVVVAVNESDAMHPATIWADDVRSLAWVATLVILAAAALTLRAVWTLRSFRRQSEALDRERTIVAITRSDLAETRARLDARTAQLLSVVGDIDEGVAVIDPNRRVTDWNQRFAVLFGMSPELVRPGVALDEILREQASAGSFGPLEDVEAEVARRVAQLRAAAGTEAIHYAGPAGSMLVVHAAAVTDGSVVMVVREATGQEHLPGAPDEAAGAPTSAPALNSVEMI